MKLTRKIPIGISACLTGHKVRYDGTDKANQDILQNLGPYFEFTAFCPEVDIGLGIPRPTLQLRRFGQTIRCVRTEDQDFDVSSRLMDSADQQQHWLLAMSGYIVKSRSPSCGLSAVPVFTGEQSESSGRGIYTGHIMRNNPLLPVEEEGNLADINQRSRFIQQLVVYHSWRTLRDLWSDTESRQRLHNELRQLIKVPKELEQNLASLLGQANQQQASYRYLLTLLDYIKQQAQPLQTKDQHRLLQKAQQLRDSITF